MFYYDLAKQCAEDAKSLASPDNDQEARRKTLERLGIVVGILQREIGLLRPKKRHLGNHTREALECLSKISNAISRGEVSEFRRGDLDHTFQKLQESAFAMGDG